MTSQAISQTTRFQAILEESKHKGCRADILIGTAIILEKIIKSITLDLSIKPSLIRRGQMAMEQA